MSWSDILGISVWSAEVFISMFSRALLDVGTDIIFTLEAWITSACEASVDVGTYCIFGTIISNILVFVVVNAWSARVANEASTFK